jgi:hypothetical protein
VGRLSGRLRQDLEIEWLLARTQILNQPVRKFSHCCIVDSEAENARRVAEKIPKRDVLRVNTNIRIYVFLQMVQVLEVIRIPLHGQKISDRNWRSEGLLYTIVTKSINITSKSS